MPDCWSCDIYVDNANQKPFELYLTVYATSKDDAYVRAMALCNLLKAVDRFPA